MGVTRPLARFGLDQTEVEFERVSGVNDVKAIWLLRDELKERKETLRVATLRRQIEGKITLPARS